MCGLVPLLEASPILFCACGLAREKKNLSRVFAKLLNLNRECIKESNKEELGSLMLGGWGGIVKCLEGWVD